MAAASNVDAIKDDFLTCSLCLQLYTKPKVLPCQHTFCQACLEKYLVYNKFCPGNCKCPFCQSFVPIPDGGVAKLPNNFLIMGLLQFVGGGSNNNQHAAQNLPSEPPDAECPLCQKPMSGPKYCQQCRLWMCMTCRRGHSIVPATKNHQFKSQQDVLTHSLKQLKQIEELTLGLVEETDTCQAVFSRKQQILADQKSEATSTIEATASCLHSAVDVLHEKMLLTLHSQMTGAHNNLNMALEEADSRKDQLDRVKRRVKVGRNLTELEPLLCLVNDLQKDLRQLIPLPNKPFEMTSVNFHPSPLLLPSLQADFLGHITTCEESAERLPFPEASDTLRFEAIYMHCSSTLVSGVAVSASDTVMFSLGNKGLYCYDLDNHNLFSNCKDFNKPWGVAAIPNADTLVTDAGPHPGEGFVAACDKKGALKYYLAKGLTLPRGIAVGYDNQVYVCDQEDRCIYILESFQTGVVKKVLKKDADGKYLFLSPMAVAVSSSGDIVVSDAGRLIKIFSKTFTAKVTYQSPLPDSELWGVCVDWEDRVYVADWKHGIHVLAGTQEAKFLGLLKGVEAAGIVAPTALMYCRQTNTLLVGAANMIYRSSRLELSFYPH